MDACCLALSIQTLLTAGLLTRSQTLRTATPVGAVKTEYFPKAIVELLRLELTSLA